jgi:ABC-2 type transport system ATP-binding protein/lipopolysaccharide transport system ATP-binding protein
MIAKAESLADLSRAPMTVSADAPRNAAGSSSIDLVDVVVEYPLYTTRGRSLKSAILKTVGGKIGHDEADRVSVRAVDNVTMSLRPGDRLAIIGGNGAGKSTLLRVFAGIIEPASGVVNIKGRVTSLIEMSMGMDPEATGYENIIMRGVFLGMSYAEAKAHVREVEEFSGLGEYLGFPVRTYSSGMQLRLSFAISTTVNPDIMVLDEIIGVGDAAFLKKAEQRMATLVHASDIVVIASHDINLTRELCNRGVFMKSGRVAFDGPIEDAIGAYQEVLEQGACA